IRDVGNSLERLLLEVLSKGNREVPEPASIRKLHAEVQKLLKDRPLRYRMPPKFEAYVWYINQLRNFVSHEARKASFDDMVEVLRMFSEFVSWYMRLYGSDSNRLGDVAESMPELLPFCDESGVETAWKIPRPVHLAIERFRKAYAAGNAKKLYSCFARDFRAEGYYWDTAEELAEALAEAKSEYSGDLHIEFSIKGQKLDNEGRIWWKVEYRAFKDGTVFDEGTLWIRFVDYRRRVAKIAELHWVG
ncbi:MAG: hypothetical protein D6806_03030, partial [Deltaproteobacteria bacterium]